MTAQPCLFVLVVCGLEAINRRLAIAAAAALAVLFVAIDLHGTWVQMPEVLREHHGCDPPVVAPHDDSSRVPERRSAVVVPGRAARCPRSRRRWAGVRIATSGVRVLDWNRNALAIEKRWRGRRSGARWGRSLAVGDANCDPMPRCVGRHADAVGYHALPQHRPGLDHHIVPQDGPLDARGGINPRIRSRRGVSFAVRRGAGKCRDSRPAYRCRRTPPMS